jgi:hypothetical protein
MKRSKRELKAIAYALSDEIETRARKLMEQCPSLSFNQAIDRAMLLMLEKGN